MVLDGERYCRYFRTWFGYIVISPLVLFDGSGGTNRPLIVVQIAERGGRRRFVRVSLAVGGNVAFAFGTR